MTRTSCAATVLSLTMSACTMHWVPIASPTQVHAEDAIVEQPNGTRVRVEGATADGSALRGRVGVADVRIDVTHAKILVVRRRANELAITLAVVFGLIGTALIAATAWGAAVHCCAPTITGW
ncbi:MAG TPA: hypothetical protein VGH87_28270 [Polyangiaceae bacterium]